MRRKFLRLWVEALRSGKFRKRKDSLQSAKRSNCCCVWGVACVVYDREIEPLNKEKGNERVLYNGSSVIAPACVRKLVGEDIVSLGLEIHNDETNMTFDQMADMIEERI